MRRIASPVGSKSGRSGTMWEVLRSKGAWTPKKKRGVYAGVLGPGRDTPNGQVRAPCVLRAQNGRIDVNPKGPGRDETPT